MINVNNLFETLPWLHISYAIISLLIGIGVATALTRLCYYYASKRTSLAQARTFQRITFYLILTIFTVISLQQLGFKLGILLGAAGILSIAIGFASQNAMANIISGIFLSFERPFRPGHTIRAAGITGEVLSIDLLSTKLRQFDNTLARIPNEALLKADIINYSHFDTRRIEIIVAVDYKSLPTRVTDTLLTTLDKHHQVLKQPAPSVRFEQMAESSMQYKCFAWTKTADFLTVKSQLQTQIKQALDQAGIEIPYPHVAVIKK